jgi:hypothetical protein
MYATKKPLRYWFKAMWWFTTRKSSVNAISLKDLLAWVATARPGLGCTSSDALPFAMAAKNYPATWKSMKFISASKIPENVAAALAVSQVY